MKFDLYDEQIKARREKDERLFSESFHELASVLQRPKYAKTLQEQSRSAIMEILSIMGAKIPEMPDVVTDLDEQLTYLCRPSGILRRKVELLGDWYKHAEGLMLARTKCGTLVVIKPGRFSGCYYKDSNARTVKINGKHARNFEKDAYFFYKPFAAKKLKISDLGSFMVKSLSTADMVFVIAISLLIALTGLVLPYMNKQIFDNIIPSGIKGNIPPIAVLLASVTISASLFAVSKGIILARIRNKISLNVQSAAMMRLFSLPAPFFRRYSAGNLTSRIMTIHALCMVISDTILSIGLSAVFSLIYIFQMQRYAPALVLPGLIAIFSVLVFLVLTSLFQLKYAQKSMKISAKLSGLVYALFTGIQKIKLAGAEKRAFAKWSFLYRKGAEISYAPPMFLRLNESFSIVLTLGGTMALYFFATFSRVSVADFLAFNVAYGSVSGAIMALSGVAMTAISIKPLMEMVQPIMEQIPENTGNKKIVTSLSGNIEINQVFFRYDENSPPILDNVSLKIKRGDYIALMGKTGSGKSTLFRLLLGFEKPQKGSIYYDGQDLDKLDLSSLRRQIAVVMQGAKLFPGSIFSNIVIGAPWKTMEDAWKAAEISGVADDIRAMPMNMHTMISEGSGGVSGGQRQKILIARALVSEPKILLFDEATSALDNISQRHVCEAIQRFKSTRLVIAHRISTIQDCDKIIVLDDGRIAEEGSYAVLMAKKGLFYEMARRQTL